MNIHLGKAWMCRVNPSGVTRLFKCSLQIIKSTRFGIRHKSYRLTSLESTYILYLVMLYYFMGNFVSISFFNKCINKCNMSYGQLKWLLNIKSQSRAVILSQLCQIIMNLFIFYLRPQLYIFLVQVLVLLKFVSSHWFHLHIICDCILCYFIFHENSVHIFK